jgi:hypothetical protein
MMSADLLDSTVALRDGKPITDMQLGFVEKIALNKVLKKIEGTDVEKLLKEHARHIPPGCRINTDATFPGRFSWIRPAPAICTVPAAGRRNTATS